MSSAAPQGAGGWDKKSNTSPMSAGRRRSLMNVLTQVTEDTKTTYFTTNAYTRIFSPLNK